MPREVWDPNKPSAAFTPTQTPMVTFNPSTTDPWNTAVTDVPLKTSVQEKTASGGIIGKAAEGITYGQGQGIQKKKKTTTPVITSSSTAPETAPETGPETSPETAP